MDKIKTGRTFSPNEYRELPACLTCGKVVETICDNCEGRVFNKCEVCGIILRTEKMDLYTYDIKEEFREGQDKLKVSKVDVIEFVYEADPLYPPVSDTLCEGCVDWKEKIKDICFVCENDFNNTPENYKLNGNTCEVCAPRFQVDMGKMKEVEEEVIEPLLEYKFDSANHIHTYLDKPLLGTSTIVGVIAKPLTWWASGLACEKFGWINKKDKEGNWRTKEERLDVAVGARGMIAELDDEEYLKLLDDAYKAHSVKLDKTATAGTDLHAELENFVKMKMTGESNEGYSEKIVPFIMWAQENVAEFLWSEAHCYSNELWVGGITDCGVRLKDGRTGIIDFKSSKEAYESQFIQCAGYDIQLSENGGFTKEGYPLFKLEKPIDFYAIVPFGAKDFKVELRHNTEELKQGFRSAVCLYKLTTK